MAHYKLVWKKVHGQRIKVKVYPPATPIGASNYTRYHKKNLTGATLNTAQSLSKARFGDGVSKNGRVCPDTFMHPTNPLISLKKI